MRRLYIVWLGFVLLTFSSIPTMAQGGTIANVIQNRSDSTMDFTILQEFLDAAPAVRNRLNRTGTYTIFAPNDRAFRNLEGALDLDLSTILSDVEVVTAILNYHIIDASLSAQALRQRDGQVIATRLQNAFVGIRVDDNNTIVVNNVVEVIESNLPASNGRLHVLNDVLLNRVINTLIDDRLRSTASATVTPTATPPSTPTPIPASTPQALSSAYIRIANFVTDSPVMGISINSQILIDDVEYAEIANFVSVPQGIYTAIIQPDSTNNTLEIDVDLTLLNGDFVTIVLVGSTEDDSVQAIILNDDFDALDEDESRLVILHAIDNAPPLDLLIDDEPIADGLRFSGMTTVDIQSVDSALSVVESRDDDNVLVTPQNQMFIEGDFYFIAFIGTVDDASLSITHIPDDDLRRLQGDDNVSIETSPNTVVQQGSIVDVLDAEENYTILIAALAVADADIINRLDATDAESVTFLAPTDQAFQNLFSTIGYSQKQFLANSDLVSDILLYHMIDDSLFTDDLRIASGTSIQTRLNPAQAFFVRASNNGTLFLNGSVQIIQADIEANNGIIHSIDDVLLPQSALDILGL